MSKSSFDKYASTAVRGGLSEALQVKKKHNKKSKPLDLQQRQEYHGGATFWTPRKVREARYRETVRQQDKEQGQLRKAETKELQQAARLYKQKIVEERRVAWEAAKMAKQQEKADKAAGQAAQKAACNAKKALQLSQKGKRKASGLPPSGNKRCRRGAAASAPAEASEPALAVPMRITRHGSPINLPKKYE
ncbi:hypothetical protein EJ02DRAFT_362622 [Clathrospora elynae]|uniref:Uncharacterized protein n=1 Tax=Clathrospora elynae TaxID=706981 RepID=A0A6A5S2R2_9PLEO|nr:hypothetical protein EJ02DRAFT_362622 [Clathrospora elynae]